MSRHARQSVILALLLLASKPVSADALLAGSLGQWLGQSAAPELVDVLSNHPKFKGETIRIVAMQDGRPTEGSDRLNQAMQQFLTHRLLRDGNIRIAWLNQAKHCGVPRNIAYLLGLEVSKKSRQEHRVSIAMVDVEEAIWVSGIGLRWEGRLSSSERRALQERVNQVDHGSFASPLPVGEVDQIAELLEERMRCNLPSGVDGSVFFATSDHREVNRVIRSLERELALTPLAPTTSRRQDAGWIMHASAEPVGGSASELIVTLQPNAEGEPLQRVASVFVTGLNVAASSPDIPQLARRQIVRPAIVKPDLLTALSFHPSRRAGICGTARSRANTCVEIQFQLLDPAYLVVFRTSGSKVTALNCTTHQQRAEPGTRRYRMRVPPTGLPSSRPDAGVYAIATQNARSATVLAKHVRKAPGACRTSTSKISYTAWLEEFRSLLEDHEHVIDWQVLHVRHGPTGLATI